MPYSVNLVAKLKFSTNSGQTFIYLHISLQVVILKARTSGLLSKNFHMEHSILVTTKAKSLTFECPSLVVANKGYECVLSGFTGPLDVFNYTVNGAVKETALLPSKCPLVATI
jgi:hypothetical protein